jgi:DNA-binding transcriptional LysR family regulator
MHVPPEAASLSIDAGTTACGANVLAWESAGNDVDASLPLARYLLSTEHVGTFHEHILCGTGEAVRQFILAGAGVGVLPEYMIRDDLGSRRLVKLKTKRPLLSDTFRLVFHRDNPVAPALRRFADDLRAEPLR